MADSNTPTYGFVLPEVGASADTWGTKCNTNYSDTDALLTAKATTGSANAYVLTTTLSLAAYVTGQSFLIIPNFTNSGAATINVDTLGAKNIKKNGATALVSGDLVSGTIYRIAYDGTQFQVVGATTLDATLTALAALSFSGPGIIQATASDTFTARAIGGFRANKGGLNQTAGITTATNSKVTFTTESWDTGSYYDTTNSRWTPPSGKVRISATVRCENLTGDPVVAYVYKNGAQAAVGPLYVRSGVAGRASVDFVDNANGTDYYEIYIYMVSSGTPTVIGGADESYFSGESILG